MSIFDQLIERAEAVKAEKRARVTAPAGAFGDDSKITIKLGGRSVYVSRMTEVQAGEYGRFGSYRGMHIHIYRRYGQEYKRCAGSCGMYRRKDQFSPDDRNGDGLHSWCKKCRADHERQAYRRGKRRRGKNNGRYD